MDSSFELYIFTFILLMLSLFSYYLYVLNKKINNISSILDKKEDSSNYTDNELDDKIKNLAEKTENPSDLETITESPKENDDI